MTKRASNVHDVINEWPFFLQDYKPEERKRLAKKSTSFCCEECGGSQPVALLLKPESEESENSAAAEEAKEIIKTMSFKVSLNPYCTVPKYSAIKG